VFTSRHSVNDELAWLEAEGPTSPDLVRFLTDRQADYDFLIFFSLRYYHTYHGARAVPGKAILVPTAERDEVLGLGLFPPILRSVRGLMYNSPEERALLQAVAGTDSVPGVVVGIGSEIPTAPNATRFRQRTGIRERTAIYIGRIDENKGCLELFDYWERYAAMSPAGLTLVLVGQPIVPIPDHPRIRHLGFLGDEEKFDALAAAEFLVMPSYFESLSMVALEAWALGRPVLANGRCDVLRGPAVRSNAGLYYENFGEFVEAVRVLERSPHVAETLGRNGSAFFRSHYAWPVIERKYLDMFQRLAAEDSAAAGRTMPPLPGWWGRRLKTLPPAREVLAALPSGPAMPPRQVASRPPRRMERQEPRGVPRHHEPRPAVRGATQKPAAAAGGDAPAARNEPNRGAADRNPRSGRFRRGRRPGQRGRRGGS
jgi:glycosyltransferase involved in cell wall biosynthesis